jgi:hypothetical protein
VQHLWQKTSLLRTIRRTGMKQLGKVEASYRQFRPGVNYNPETNKLYIFSSFGVTVIRGWPKPQAWRKTIAKPEWRGCRPHIDIRKRLLSVRKWRKDLVISDLTREDKKQLPFSDKEIEKIRKREEAFHSFFQTIPLEVRNAIRKFPSRQFHVLSLIARVPGALDLVYSNPVLTWMLASNWCFHKPPVQRPLEAARRLVRRKQREILEWLGFPKRESAVRIIRKITQRSLTIPMLLYLRESMRDPSILKLLSFIPRINAGVIRVVTDPTLLPHATPNLLEEIGKLREDDRIPHTAFLLKDAIGMGNILLCGGLRKKFQSIKKLREVHDWLAAKINIMMENNNWIGELPPPPLQGITDMIYPLTTVKQLVEEGYIQHNCVASYAFRVAMGEVYIYKVIAPERATLAIRKRGNSWILEQVKKACNQLVGRNTYEMIQQWLKQENRSECVRKEKFTKS